MGHLHSFPAPHWLKQSQMSTPGFLPQLFIQFRFHDDAVTLLLLFEAQIPESLDEFLLRLARFVDDLVNEVPGDSLVDFLDDASIYPMNFQNIWKRNKDAETNLIVRLYKETSKVSVHVPLVYFFQAPWSPGLCDDSRTAALPLSVNSQITPS